MNRHSKTSLYAGKPQSLQDFQGETMKDDTMGNQQITLTELGWLAGIYDGEGYLGFSRQNAKKVRSVRPDIQLVNCDPEIIVRVVSGLNMIGINPYIRERNHNKKTQAINIIVSISKFTHVKKFIDTIGKFLTGEKKARANLMLKLVNSRLPKTKKDWYTEEELKWVDEYFERLSNIKLRGSTHKTDMSKVRNLRDYTRSRRNSSEDIVRTGAKSPEVAEMSTRP